MPIGILGWASSIDAQVFSLRSDVLSPNNKNSKVRLAKMNSMQEMTKIVLDVSI
jgi:tetrahydromethanopterin S-methyltransferase subunit E